MCIYCRFPIQYALLDQQAIHELKMHPISNLINFVCLVLVVSEQHLFNMTHHDLVGIFTIAAVSIALPLFLLQKKGIERIEQKDFYVTHYQW